MHPYVQYSTFVHSKTSCHSTKHTRRCCTHSFSHTHTHTYTTHNNSAPSPPIMNDEQYDIRRGNCTSIGLCHTTLLGFRVLSSDFALVPFLPSSWSRPPGGSIRVSENPPQPRIVSLPLLLLPTHLSLLGSVNSARSRLRKHNTTSSPITVITFALPRNNNKCDI